MKHNKKIIATAIVVLFAEFVIGNDSLVEISSKNPCLSNDLMMGDSAAWAVESVNQFAQNEFLDAIETVNACFDQWGPKAGQKQKVIHRKGNSCPPVGKVSNRKKRRIEKDYLMNDVSLALWAKARSQHELGLIDESKKTYGQCIFMSCGRAWDPKGWFWSPAQDCADQVRSLID